MSNDLISRSKLNKLVEESMNNNSHKDGKIASNHNAEHLHFLKLIADMPTAYSVDKIAEQLEELREEILTDTTYDNDTVNHYLGYVDLMIDTVKAGIKG